MKVLVTGGARSGKSRYAEALAQYFANESKSEVAYIATLDASDDEMERRIAQHRSRRPARWRTVETRMGVARAVREASEEVVLLDCLSGFVSNLLLEHEDGGESAVVRAISDAVQEVVDIVKLSPKTVIIVSNEVGSGVVPAYPLGRWYRDALGMANARVARACDAAILMSVGIPQILKGTPPEVTVDA